MSKKRIIGFMLAIVCLYVLAFLSIRIISITGKFAEKLPFEVDQVLIKILIKTNESMTKSIRVMNTGKNDETITIDSNLEDLLSIPEKRFTIKPGQTKTVQIVFSSTNKQKNIEYQPGVYIGRLTVEYADLEEQIPVIVEIESKNVLFDMNLNVPVNYRRIVRGNDASVEVRLFNLEGIKPISVNMDYFLKDLDGNTIITESESVVVETQASFSKTLRMPKNLKPGSYVFASRVKYAGSVGTASYLFEVIGEEQAGLRGIFYALAIVVVIASITVVSLVLIKKYTKKRKRIEELPKTVENLRTRMKRIEERITEKKKQKIDTGEFELELQLAKEKLGKGMFQMAKEYLSSLEKRLKKGGK